MDTEKVVAIVIGLVVCSLMWCVCIYNRGARRLESAELIKALECGYEQVGGSMDPVYIKRDAAKP